MDNNNGTFTYNSDLNESGTFLLLVEENNQCGSITDVLELTVNQPITLTASNDITIASGESTQLSVSGGTQYLWSPSDFLSCSNCENPIANPNTTTTYEVTDLTAGNCVTSASVTITVDDSEPGFLFVPTAFSPNADGNNDVFEVKYAEIDIYNIRIFNRFGELVFESSDPNQTWDGYFNNINQPLSTFVWQVTYNFTYNAQIQSQKGNLTLIR